MFYLSRHDPTQVTWTSAVHVKFSYKLFSGRTSALLVADAPYLVPTHQMEPGAGLEVGMRPLMLRVGYKSTAAGSQAAFGTGFTFSFATLDYAFNMQPNGAALHRFSLALTFGPASREK